MNKIKEALKAFIKKSPIPLSKNHLYDIQTKKIAGQYLSYNSNTIDIGCHKGEILDLFLRKSPKGRHFGFEPLPHLYSYLKNKYSHLNNCIIYDYAISDNKGDSLYNYVTTNPAYSGLKKRSYDKIGERDTTIKVKTELLDNVLPQNLKIDIIKIDVEGGELGVLNGAKKTINTYKPLVIFEHGKGASDHYGTTPVDVYNFFYSVDMDIFTLTAFLRGKDPLSKKEFQIHYEKGINYYFIAANK